jgi:mono/diheme cytochrome c family protein
LFLSGLKEAGMKSLITEQTRCDPKPRRGLALAGQLAAVMLGLGSAELSAADSTAPAQWNIMVVPARETVYSGRARELFDKRCAGCHSKDGRAQTPVARQRGVRDLSESTLSDGDIIKQITRGTHDKVVDFKMPSFSGVFSSAEIESLVPVVKAFRPVAVDENAVPNPRLAGIINFPYRKSAVLERVAGSGRYFILNPNESHGGVQLAKIMPRKGTVRVWISGQTSPVTLKLNSPPAQTAKQNSRGFLYRLFHSSLAEHYGVALDNANTDLVLFLYAQLTGRTLLRSPRLPALEFNLNTTSNSAAQLRNNIQKALADHGIAAIPHGEKFLLVVPGSEAATELPHLPEFKPATSTNGGAKFPGGLIINLPNVPLSEVAELYAKLTGGRPESLASLPTNSLVNFTTQTVLSEAECAYALETLLTLHRRTPVTAGDGLFRRKPVSEASD